MGNSGTINVPNVLGSTQSAAEAMLKSAGLVVGTENKVSSFKVSVGNIVGANPEPGTLVNSGSAVDLVISTGPLMQVKCRTLSATRGLPPRHYSRMPASLSARFQKLA